MYYFMIFFAAFLFALGFMFNEKYQNICGSNMSAALKLSFYISFLGILILLIINKFRINISLFTVFVAAVYAVVYILFNYFTVKAFRYANLSVYSVFSMIGGMIIPFIYGLFLGEKITFMKIICCLFIIFSIIITIPENRETQKAFKYYIMVFILNGLFGVISKFHQLHIKIAVDSGSFLMIAQFFVMIISLTVLLFNKDDMKMKFRLPFKALMCCAGFSLFDITANYLVLLALLQLPASVQYPIVTGGVIVFSTIITIIKKADITKKEILAAAVALLSSIMIIF